MLDNRKSILVSFHPPKISSQSYPSKPQFSASKVHLPILPDFQFVRKPAASISSKQSFQLRTVVDDVLSAVQGNTWTMRYVQIAHFWTRRGDRLQAVIRNLGIADIQLAQGRRFLN